MDGTNLVSFQDFVLATRAHKITPTTELLNEAAKRTYLLARMLKGRGTEEVVQTGSKIIDQIQLKKMANAGFYRPNQNLQPKGTDTLKQIECPWRFHQGNYGWTNEQVALNNGGNAVDVYTRLKTSWEQASKLDIWDSMEDALWATPDTDEMESGEGLMPYSIPSFITNDGLAPSGFTTVMTVNPTTETRWRNQTDTFDWSTATGGSDTADLFYAAFGRLYRKLNWKRQRGLTDAAGAPATNWDKIGIFSSMAGCEGYTNLNRASNDRLRKNINPTKNDAGWGEDAYFNSVAVEYIEKLDDTTIMATATPAFYWINFEYLFPVYHSDRYMTEEGPIRGSVNQPFSWAVFFNTYYNLFCRSRRRQGIVYTS